MRRRRGNFYTRVHRYERSALAHPHALLVLEGAFAERTCTVIVAIVLGASLWGRTRLAGKTRIAGRAINRRRATHLRRARRAIVVHRCWGSVGVARGTSFGSEGPVRNAAAWQSLDPVRVVAAITHAR